MMSDDSGQEATAPLAGGPRQRLVPSSAGRQDAALFVRLAQWHADAGLPNALLQLFTTSIASSDPQSSASNASESEWDRGAALICSYFDAVGVLEKHGLLSEDLVLDWLAPGPVWDRLRSYVLGARRRTGVASLWTNFEWLATTHKRRTREYST